MPVYANVVVPVAGERGGHRRHLRDRHRTRRRARAAAAGPAHERRPDRGCGLSVTIVPDANTAVHVVPQSMPGGIEVTVPTAVPVFVIENITPAGASIIASIVGAASTVSWVEPCVSARAQPTVSSSAHDRYPRIDRPDRNRRRGGGGVDSRGAPAEATSLRATRGLVGGTAHNRSRSPSASPAPSPDPDVARCRRSWWSSRFDRCFATQHDQSGAD